jgi:anti-sigma B factor antagonist
MSATATKMSVCVNDQIACVRVEGRADFRYSESFKQLVLGLQAKGYSRFILDLSECLLLDSTFAGILAGLGRDFLKIRGSQDTPAIYLLNANSRVTETIDNLGITQFFRFETQMTPTTPAYQKIEPISEQTDLRATTLTCLTAHRILMEVNPANVPKFKDVVIFLEEDLKKLEARAVEKPPVSGA